VFYSNPITIVLACIVPI